MYSSPFFCSTAVSAIQDEFSQFDDVISVFGVFPNSIRQNKQCYRPTTCSRPTRQANNGKKIKVASQSRYENCSFCCYNVAVRCIIWTLAHTSPKVAYNSIRCLSIFTCIKGIEKTVFFVLTINHAAYETVAIWYTCIKMFWQLVIVM